ncbi:hypothetical protein BR93DRAFT_380926 [Coniochaeta sp. PMI_546]|nr:hypothetical protein BR93DRAFT_380926 [Coniochaeta sp. PMI_546]
MNCAEISAAVRWLAPPSSTITAVIIHCRSLSGVWIRHCPRHFRRRPAASMAVGLLSLPRSSFDLFGEGPPLTASLRHARCDVGGCLQKRGVVMHGVSVAQSQFLPVMFYLFRLSSSSLPLKILGNTTASYLASAATAEPQCAPRISSTSPS